MSEPFNVMCAMCGHINEPGSQVCDQCEQELIERAHFLPSPIFNADKWYRRWWSWSPDMIKAAKHNKRFTRLAINRLVVGHFRYGVGTDPHAMPPWGGDYQYIDRLKEKLALYEKTGNRELLLDIHNAAMFEFSYPSHPCAHFVALDQGIDK